MTWQDAAKKWPGPDAPQGSGASSTSIDVKQFNQDMICQVYQINFDRTRRDKLFGNGDGAPLYMYLDSVVRWMKLQTDAHGESINPQDQADLNKMSGTMKSDIATMGVQPLKWYQDWQQMNDEIDRILKDDFKYTRTLPDPFFTSRLQYNVAISYLFFGGARGPDPQSGPDYIGDAIIYSCENDATGTTFQLVPDKLDFTSLFDNLQSLGDATQIVAKILALMFLAQMIIRLFFINLYIITAPLGIVCWALPGKVGQPVARLWLQGFISTVMVQFLMVVALIVIQVLLGNMLAFVGGDPNHIIGNLSDGTLRDIMRIACLWFVARIPSLIGNAPMRTLTSAGQMMGQAVGATIAMQITQFQMITQVASSAVSIAGAAR